MQATALGMLSRRSRAATTAVATIIYSVVVVHFQVWLVPKVGFVIFAESNGADMLVITDQIH